MSAYVFVEIFSPKNGMEQYREKVAATIFKFGGKYHCRGSKVEVLECDLGCYDGKTPGAVLVEFPSVTAAKEWYFSKEYQAILPERLAAARANCLLIEGTVNLPSGSAVSGS